MPEMDGIECINEIRKIEEKNSISSVDGAKIVVVTEHNNSKNFMDAFKAGCDGFVSKPIIKNSIFSAIKEAGIFLEY